MKTKCVLKNYCLLSAIALCAGSLSAAVRPVSGGVFDPPLVPTMDPGEVSNANPAGRVIAENSTLVGIEIDFVVYDEVEGPTNAVVSGGKVYSPFLNTFIPSTAESVTGLTLDGLFNFGSAKVMFASSVTTETEGGFFTTEWGNNEADVYVYPLDANGDRIGSWELHLVASDFGSGSLLKPHGLQLAVKDDVGDTKPVNDDPIGGAAFKITDFTGGSGVLNNVHGLEFVDPSPGYDLVVAGIYRGTGEAVMYRAGRAAKMLNATFDQPIVNPMTNDFALTGFDGAESITAPSQAYQFDTGTTDGSVFWPSSGVQPTRTNALLGLDINGVNEMGYWDFMFDDPVTNAADGFFMIEEVSIVGDAAFVFPLDADRRPISTYSIITVPSTYQWQTPTLMGGKEVKWDGSHDSWDGSSQIGGVVMPLAAFAGGTGGLTNVCGIRVYYYDLKWSSERLDPLVIGSYVASKEPRPIYDVECSTHFTPTPAADHLSGILRHDWTLTAITTEMGRFTDLEGPTNMVRTTTDGFRAYPIDGAVPDSSLDAAIGLNSWISVNPGTCYWYFEGAVTNGSDGGFFFFNDNNDDSVKFEPLDSNGNLIAGGYSVTVDRTRHLTVYPQSFASVAWKYYAVTDTNPAANTNWETAPRGAAFTLDSFQNASGESLTNDVHGLKMTYVAGNSDPLMVGIYKGPSVPAPRAGLALPITAATFDPPLQGGTQSNDAAVVSVQSAESVSSSINGPDDIYIYKHNSSQVYFPRNGTCPDPVYGAPWTEGYINALDGLDIDGVANVYYTDYMFNKPVKRADDGFFAIEHSGNDFVKVLPLDADRVPISTYSVQIIDHMMGHLGYWLIDSNGAATADMRGTMIRHCDFAGGTGDLGAIYGVRIIDLGGWFDPAVVGQFFGPPDGTMIMVQ